MTVLFAYAALLAIVEPVLVPEPEAAPSPYELAWAAPSECDDQAAVRARIERVVSIGEARQRGLLVTGHVRSSDGQWHLDLFIVGADVEDRRSFTADSCTELTAAAALIVATSLDPEINLAAAAVVAALDPDEAGDEPLLEDETTPEPAQITDSPTLALGEPVPVPRPDLATPRSAAESQYPPEPRGSIRVAGLGGFGELPGVSGGVHLAASLLLGAVRLEVAGHYWAPRVVPSGAIAVQAGAAALRGCWRAWLNKMEIPVCAGFEAGGVRADSRADFPRGARLGRWLAGTAGVAVVRRFGWLGPWLSTDLVVAMGRTHFSSGDRSLFEAQPVAVRLLAGVEFYFGVTGPRQTGHGVD